ncbi:hypothetical protein BKK79_16835 [Cupriavidus sp. USMAA2-4]|uniref:DUF2939 domain-containing protein n=1 Tax=Cupriavidus sp. USMAA2-4 TaxID=876364 RepID=UPI0008A689BC|nr:DUF2939 domain-containing protein [Cupriavidus sp. USMAA2-4]AOY93282.1 hypothetical protein BKK79_16835 [Cupriavidus sp. USMAA2-4]
MKRKTALGTLALLVTALASSYASPYWTLRQMHAAIKAHDAQAFSRYVDYPALRESLKAQALLSLQQRLGLSGASEAPLAGVGRLLGMAMVGTVIDAMVSPAGAMALMARGEAGAPTEPPAQPGPAVTPDDGQATRPARESLRYDVSYRAWDRVDASATRADGERIVVELRRDGLWSWQWSGVRLPGLATRP